MATRGRNLCTLFSFSVLFISLSFLFLLVFLFYSLLFFLFYKDDCSKCPPRNSNENCPYNFTSMGTRIFNLGLFEYVHCRLHQLSQDCSTIPAFVYRSYNLLSAEKSAFFTIRGLGVCPKFPPLRCGGEKHRNFKI